MPALPRVRLPHPVAGVGSTTMASIAENVAAEIIEQLRGARA